MGSTSRDGKHASSRQVISNRLSMTDNGYGSKEIGPFKSHSLEVETSTYRIPRIVFFASGVDETKVSSIGAKPLVDEVPVERIDRNVPLPPT